MDFEYKCFVPKNFRGESLSIIYQADEIIRDYAAQGYTLTLRQLYYQFVARDLIPNNDRSYKRLGSIVTDARLSGDLPWNGIEDRNRGKKGCLIQEDVGAILRNLPRQFAVDMWARQDYYVEVWVEKDALSSVIQRACGKYRVPYMACKGYLSASEAYAAGQRMRAAEDRGKNCVVFHLGDHDPSGLDMTRDNQDRLYMLSEESMVEVKRLALNMPQIERYNPPPNPTKITDSRAEGYLREHGRTSWELDALEPSVVVDLIQRNISRLISDDIWEEDQERERDQEIELAKIGDNWSQVQEFLASLEDE